LTHERSARPPPVAPIDETSSPYVGGLHPAINAKSLRAKPDGQVLVSDGPHTKTKEHVGGFWVLEAGDRGEALAWGRKAVVPCKAPVEVRPPVLLTTGYKLFGFLIAFFAALHRESRSPSGR
jgi:YCII-related domain